VVKITAAGLVGHRWYYAFIEQVPQPQISYSGDTAPAPLYEDHPNARTGVVPGDGIGPYLTEINNRQLNVGDFVQVRHKTETPIGTVFECEATTPASGVIVPQWVSTVFTGRTVIALAGSRTFTDGVLTSGSATLTSATASFVSGDAGKSLAGGGTATTAIPFGTTISSVTSSTAVVMSQAALASATAQSVTIGGILGFPGHLQSWNSTTGVFASAGSVWFYSHADIAPTLGQPYLCSLLGTDGSGQQIWDVMIDLGGGVNARSSNWTFAQSDCGQLVTFASISALTGTLPIPSTATGDLGVVWYCDVLNLGPGTLTIATPSGVQINSAATLTLGTKQFARVFSDGLNYWAEPCTAGGGGMTGTLGG